MTADIINTGTSPMPKTARTFDLQTASLKGQYIVEAGAGTGKTYSLEHLVLRLIVESGATVDRILLVTFTKAATAEIGERVRSMLERLAATLESGGVPDDGEEAKLLEKWLEAGIDVQGTVDNALEAFDDACIFTIHSFCQKMLSEFAFTRGGAFDTDYSAGNAELIDQVVEEFIREQLGKVPPEAAAKIADWRKGLREILEKLSAAGPEAKGEYRAAAPTGRAKENAPSEETMSVLEACLNDFFEKAPARLYELEKREGVSGFDRLLTDMAELCRTDPELVRRVRSRFDAVLIDEFQDTDPLQYSIFRTLFLEEGIENGPEAVFFVGDPKQAIYAFRSAELATYLQARDEMLAKGEGHVLSLRKNYRSAAPLVSFINRWFEGSAGVPHFLNDALPFEPSESASKSQPLIWRHDGVLTPLPAVSVRMLAGDEPEGGYKADKAREYEAEMIASDIANLLLHDVWVRKETKTESGTRPARRLRPGDVTILVRNRTNAGFITDALAKRGIRSALVGSGSVFATEEAAHVRAVLEAFADPDDRRVFNTARATRIWGRTFEDLNDETQRTGVEDKTILQNALKAWSFSGPAGAFAAIFEARETAKRILPTSGGEQTLINYSHIIELLQSDYARLRTPETLLRRLSHRIDRADGDDEAGRIRAVLNDDAVCLQTIHTSKGLEFPVVYAAFAGELQSADEKIRCRRDKTSTELRYIANADGLKPGDIDGAAAEAKEEDVRLAYVAMTRASSRLVLPLYFPTNSRAASYWENGFLTGLLGTDDVSGTAVERILKNATPVLSKNGRPKKSAKPKTTEIFPVIREMIRERLTAIAAAVKSDMTDGSMKDTPEINPADFAEDGEDWCVADDWRRTCPQVELLDSTQTDILSKAGIGAEVPRAAHDADALPADAFRQHALRCAWMRSSFTGVSRCLRHGYGSAENAEGDEYENEEEAEAVFSGTLPEKETPAPTVFDDAEEAENDKPSENSDPLASVKGTEFGKWLHRIFETIFLNPEEKQGIIGNIARWVANAPCMDGLSEEAKTAAADRLQSLVSQTVRIPILRGAKVPGGISEEGRTFTLDRLKKGECLPEMPFLMSVTEEKLRVEDIASMMEGFGYPMEEEERMMLRGYMTGSIDLVFYADGRYWIIDWKSNFLGSGDGPSYTQEAMKLAVKEKHYSLQYVIYLLALKRHLKVTAGLTEENVWDHIGGAFYVFFRGINENAPSEEGGHQGILFDRPREAVDALDRLLGTEGENE